MVKPYFKPLDRPDREETWFCYFSPRKTTQAAILERKAISQVPDLNIGMEEERVDTETKACRWRLKESDSKYVKLAKAGGQKDLLQFRDVETKSKVPKSYPIPVWYRFDEESVKKVTLEQDEQRKRDLEKIKLRQEQWYNKQKNTQTRTRNGPPAWLMHEAYKPLEHSTRELKRPIIGFDNLSAWKREELEKLPVLNVAKSSKTKIEKDREGRSLSRTTAPKLKLPETSKRQLPGERKFTSSGYATRWYDKWYVRAVQAKQ